MGLIMRSGALAIYLLGFSLRVFGQTAVVPVQAEFLKAVQIHNLAAGATVFAVDFAAPARLGPSPMEDST